MQFFEGEAVQELRFDEHGNPLPDANGFSDEDLPPGNLQVTTEAKPTRDFIPVDLLEGSLARIEDEDEDGTPEEYLRPPVFTARVAVDPSDQVSRIDDTKPYVHPKNEHDVCDPADVQTCSSVDQLPTPGPIVYRLRPVAEPQEEDELDEFVYRFRNRTASQIANPRKRRYPNARYQPETDPDRPLPPAA